MPARTRMVSAASNLVLVGNHLAQQRNGVYWPIIGTQCSRVVPLGIEQRQVGSLAAQHALGVPHIGLRLGQPFRLPPEHAQRVDEKDLVKDGERVVRAEMECATAMDSQQGAECLALGTASSRRVALVAQRIGQGTCGRRECRRASRIRSSLRLRPSRDRAAG